MTYRFPRRFRHLITLATATLFFVSVFYAAFRCADAAGKPTKPDAPSNLTVTAITNTRIDLAWADNSNNETGFIIYRRSWSRPESWTLITKNVTPNATTYTDNTVTTGVTYYYRVVAQNSAGTSAFSNVDYDSTSLVIADQIPIATTFGMPLGDDTIKSDLERLSIGTCTNGYPRIRFNENDPSNAWYVATAFNENTWVNALCDDLGLYATNHDFHPGEDWNSTEGSGTWPNGDARAPIYSIANGVVIFNSMECSANGADAIRRCNDKSYKGGFGNTLILAHQTASGEYVLSFYGHLADPPFLAEGTIVSQGDQIGFIGSTGTGFFDAANTYHPSYHLHFEIRKAGMLTINSRTGKLALVEKPGFWPESFYPDDVTQQQFIAANYYSPSEFLRSPGGFQPSLFFDGASDSRFANAAFERIATDSQGRLLLSTTYYSLSCGFGVCDHRLTSISPNGTLNWLSPSLSNDSLANKNVYVGQNDRVYILPSRNEVFAFDSSGNQQPGWPVALPYSFNSDQPAVVDQTNGAVYVRTGVSVSFTEFPFAITSLNLDGSLGWRTDYANNNFGGARLLQGPAGNLFTYFGGGMVNLNRNTGQPICETATNVLASVGDADGAYFSTSGISVIGGDCSVSTIYPALPGLSFDVRLTDGTRVFAVDFPNVASNPDDNRLFAITKGGAFLWRNNRIANPNIHAIRNGFLYVMGKDTNDNNRQKLFLIDTASGQINNSLATAPYCIACGVSAGVDATIYLNDVGSTRIYRVN